MNKTLTAVIIAAALFAACATPPPGPTPPPTSLEVAVAPTVTAPPTSTPAPSATPTITPANEGCVRARTEIPEGQNPTRFITSGPAVGCYDSVGGFLDDIGLAWGEFAPGTVITFWTQWPVDSEGLLSPPTPTVIPTGTQTAIPTNTPVPTPTFDLSAAGFPAQPIPYWNAPPAGFLAYDEANYHVYERVMHGRPIRFVVYKQAGIPSDFRQEMTEWVFYAWASGWEIFGGFPYESYTFKIPIDSSTFWGAQGIGHEVDVEGYVEEKRGGWGAYREHEWRIDFAHEIFHAWNQRSLPAQEYFRAWFGEGCTEYYSYRITEDLDPEFGYDYGMQRMWHDYARVMGTSDDMPLAEADIYEIEPRLQTPIIYMKGGLVCYMIDQRLVAEGLSMDDLLRALYVEFVTTGARHTPQTMQATLELLTGASWSQFFDDYVYGTERLPLDGTFEYLQH